MGGTSSNARYDYLLGPAQEMMKRDDIGRKNLRTNYYTLFMFLTILLILAAASAFACGIYLTIKIYFRFPGKNEELEQKYLSIFIASLLFALIVIFSWYYAYHIGNDISHADILVTDMTRLTTAPLSDVSFKANMTNLIANRLGYENATQKQEVFNNLNRSVIVDPINYFQSKEGRNRFKATDEEHAIQMKILRRGGMTGSGMAMYRDETLPAGEETLPAGEETPRARKDKYD